MLYYFIGHKINSIENRLHTCTFKMTFSILLKNNLKTTQLMLTIICSYLYWVIIATVMVPY